MPNDLIAWQQRHKLCAKMAAKKLGYSSTSTIDKKRSGKRPITNQDRIIMANYDEKVTK